MPTKPGVAYFGSHINKHKSGWLDTLREVSARGGNAAQIFVASPIGKMSASTLESLHTNAADIKEYLRLHDMKLFIHSPYTLNFAKDPVAEKPYWIEAILKELRVADAMGAQGCVLHLGKAVGHSQNIAETHMFNNVSEVCKALAATPSNRAKLLIETSSGQGSEILPTLDNDLSGLAGWFKRFPAKCKEHIAFCVDTCHIFAAGYDISTPAKASKFFEQWDALIGLQYLALVHFNNSVHGYGERKDRHACIQYGKIAIEGLVAFAKQAMDLRIPVILETPAGPDEIVVLKAITNAHNITEAIDAVHSVKLTSAVKLPSIETKADSTKGKIVFKSTPKKN